MLPLAIIITLRFILFYFLQSIHCYTVDLQYYVILCIPPSGLVFSIYLYYVLMLPYQAPVDLGSAAYFSPIVFCGMSSW